MTVIRTEAEASATNQREFIGKAWINEATVGKNAGTKFISVKLDRNIASVSIEAGQQITLWPNLKRDGKKDADYRVSVK